MHRILLVITRLALWRGRIFLNRRKRKRILYRAVFLGRALSFDTTHGYELKGILVSILVSILFSILVSVLGSPMHHTRKIEESNHKENHNHLHFKYLQTSIH